MRLKYFAFMAFLLSFYSLFVPQSCFSLPRNRVVDLRELYRQHKGQPDDTNTTGNFLRATDGTVLFFLPEKRELFKQVFLGGMPSLIEKFLVLKKPYRRSQSQLLNVSRTPTSLLIGPFTIDEPELDRLRLTSGWSDVIEFCKQYVLDDNGKYLPLEFSSITRLNKNEFLICGGHDFFGDKVSKPFRPPEKLAQVFDVSCKRVVKIIPLAAIHSGNRSILLPNGKVLITGSDSRGSADPTLLEIVDPSAGTANLLQSRLTCGMSYSTLCLDSSGRCLILPGISYPDQILTIDRLDPSTDKMETVALMSTPRWYTSELTEIPHNALMLENDLLLVSGGSACGKNADDMFHRRDAEFVQLDSP
ncbi:MAG: hypothetical protein IPK73_29835 [Candidatus Obscuribacter sp.]|nr:hypothetical protein [Candidatus Obscuribacter sp.]